MTPKAQQHRQAGTKPRRAACKARAVTPLTPDQAARLATHQAKQRWLVESLAKGRERQRRHPRRTMWVNNLVGLAGVVSVVLFFASFLHIIRW